MNEAVPLARFGTTGLDDLLALVGLPSQRRSSGKLSSSAEEIFRGISSFVDGLLLRAIAARTKSEFDTVRKEVFGPYVDAVTSLAKLARIVVPGDVIERVLNESFCELEAEFRDHGLTRFGPAAKEQAMFTIWTLRRTSRIISKIVSSGPVPENLKDQDAKVASDFSFHTAWTQFHLDCLLAAIRCDQSIQLDVLPEIIDGLRSAVDAYGYSRQGLNLRVPEQEPYIQPYQWDEEDQELLDSSMKDMEAEALDG